MIDVIPVLLGVGWGALAATPLARRARRVAVVERLTPTRPEHPGDPGGPHPPPRISRAARVVAVMERATGPVALVVRSVVHRRSTARRDAELAHDLPVVIDLLAVAVGAGCTPYLAVDVAAEWAPVAAARRLDAVRQDCALGVTFAGALERLVAESPMLRPLADALLASERFGAPVGDALSRLAGEERGALRRRAEARARTVPVKLLFPLVFLVLPAFALLSVIPVLIAGLASS